MTAASGRAVKGYFLREVIGAGCSGTVYRAYQPAMEREVALKHVAPSQANHPEFARHFDMEARRIAHLDHPYIVPLYDYWRGTDGAYLVMRLLPGGNLRGKAWSLEALVPALTQITSALAT